MAIDRGTRPQPNRTGTADIDRARSETQQLQRLASSLATSENLAELTAIAVRELGLVLQADAIALFLASDEDHFDLVDQRGCTEKFKKEWKSISRDLVPLSANFSYNDSLFVGNSINFLKRVPSAIDIVANAQRDTICYAPLIVSNSVTGFIGYSYNAHREHMARPEFVMILFSMCAQALEASRLRDYDRTKELESQLAHQAKSDFLANICHEIRTPVGVIKGFSDMLCEIHDLEEEPRRWAQTIQRNSHTLIELIGEVLDFSAAEAKEIKSEISPFDLHEMVAGIDACVRFKSSEKGLKLVITSRNFPRKVASDLAKIRQIVITLINNAINFTSKGKVLVDLEWDRGQLNCSVADSGCGISPALRSAIFKPRIPYNSSHLRHFGGNQVGLSTARALARSLGGELELTQSVVNGGSVFSFHVECGEHAERRAPADPAAAASKLNLKGSRVLLVEDCVDNQDLISHLLSRFGATVEIADCGTAGMEKALNHEYSLILLDIQLPEMDGRQVLKNLRALGYKKPIVALTALAIKSEKDKAMAEGFDAYLTKPVHLAELLKTVKQLIQGHLVH